MRKLFLLIAFLLLCGISASAQQSISVNLSSSGTACLSTGASPNCVSLPILKETTTASVTVSGTFSATVQFETSNFCWRVLVLSMNPTGERIGCQRRPPLRDCGRRALHLLRTFACVHRRSRLGRSPSRSTRRMLLLLHAAAALAAAAAIAVTKRFRRTPVVTAASEDYTLDQIGSPATPPAAFSSAGVFTDLAMNETLTYDLTG